MCGVAGIFARRNWSSDELHDMASRMTGVQVHRGPDDRGVGGEAGAGFAVGFRRLAIVDLPAQGHQPMQSSSGRFMLIFNGEVYNYRSLRVELESLGCAFRGHSDTEVILAA